MESTIKTKTGRNTCSTCLGAGMKLFLKGAKCFTSKCPVARRSASSGSAQSQGKRKRASKVTEFGIRLREKQKVKAMYGVLEKQFKNYYKKALSRGGDTGDLLLQALEKRLDNVVYRLGLARSRAEARQLVNHGHFLVNTKKINIPSYEVIPESIISICAKSKNKFIFTEMSKTLEKYEVPPWLFLDKDKLEAKVLTVPSTDQLKKEIDPSLIIEYYSR